MNQHLLEILKKRPSVYEPGCPQFWNDAHIAKSMLKAHLNPELDSATRKLSFVKKSADWIARIADSNKRPLLLDLGCGPGIYANLFAQQRFSVTGVDLSPFSIAYAKEHSERSIEYSCQNYLDLSYDNAFDVVTLIYCDFGVLNPSQRQMLLQKIHRALNDGGLFIVDVCSPAQYTGWDEKTEWTYSSGGFWSENPYVCLYAFYRYDDCRTYNQQYVIIDDESTRCFNIWNHAFTPEELCADLTRAGFSHTQLFGSVAGDKYTEQSETICVVSKK